MKLTKKLFKDGCKFTIIEDKKFIYQYEFGCFNKIERITIQEYMGEYTEEFVEATYACKRYQTYFQIHIDFFGIHISKKIFYKNCTVFEN